MKKRMGAVMIGLAMMISFCYFWQPILCNVGMLTARFILSDNLLLMPLGRTDEIDEGYDEHFFETTDTERTAKTVNLAMESGKYKTVDGIALKNGADKTVDIPAMLRAGFSKPTFEKDQPAVLIYHTHVEENYLDSEDNQSGVIYVGEEMKSVFEEAGLKTIHLTEDFTRGGSFNTSYTRSLCGAETVLKKYSSIRIVLDIHRDSINDGDGACCPLTTIGGEAYAQVMIICGTDAKGLSHPYWKDNLCYALALAKNIEGTYPSLCRPINLNANRYNTHITPYTLLMEIGSEQNTTAEAVRAGRAVAKSIIKTVQ